MNIYQLIAYYVSSIVGVGILTIPVIAYKMAGNYSILAWILLMLVSIPFASLFAYIAIKKPHPSGVGEFIKSVLGDNTSKSIVLLMIFTMIIGNPVMGITSARYLSDIVFISNEYLLLYAYIFMLISILFNLIGVNLSAKIQTILLCFLIIGLLSLIILSIPHINWQRLDFKNTLNHIQPIGQAMVIGFFSFLGWENVCSLATDVKNPKKTFTISVIFSIIIISILYTGIAISYAGLVNETNKNNTLISVILNSTIGNRKIFGNILALSLMILSTNAWVLGASKLLSSINISIIKNNKFNLLCLSIFYGITLFLLFLNNGLEDILIKIANMNFFIVYIFSFIAINIFSTLKKNPNKSKLLFYTSILGIFIVLVMMTFIEVNIIALSIGLYTICKLSIHSLSKYKI